MRSKENADDYRYMPDPDLPPVELDERYIANIKRSVPKLPMYWRSELAKHKLDASIIESLIDSEVEYSINNLKYLVSLDKEIAKVIANWIVNIELPLRADLSDNSSENVKLSNSARHKMYREIYSLYIDSLLSSSNLKGLINRLLTLETLPVDIFNYASQQGLIQSSDKDELELAVEQAIKNNPKAVKDIQSGQDKAIKFLVGQVMAITKGQANPVMVAEIILNKTGD